MTLDEYISKVWNEERLNQFSYFSGWHVHIHEIVEEVWKESRKELIALLEECLENGKQGPETLYAWFANEIYLIDQTIYWESHNAQNETPQNKSL